MQPVLTVEEMRAADAAALSGVSHETLVERAGTAVATTALSILGGPYGRRVIVIAGKGSNSADGRVAAAHLLARGVRVEVIDAKTAPALLGPADLVIDGAYGTGFRGTYVAPTVVPGTPVLAIDLPSGLNAETGEGCDGAVTATHTVTFAALKTGLLEGDGPRLAGRVTVADIGVATGTAAAALITDDDVSHLVPPRPRQSHKWTTALAIAAGSVGMEGSAVLATRGAMAAGAGMIRLGSPGNPQAPWPVEAVRVSLDASEWAGSVSRRHHQVSGPRHWSGVGYRCSHPRRDPGRRRCGQCACGDRRRRAERTGREQGGVGPAGRSGRTYGAHAPRRRIRAPWPGRHPGPTGSPRPAGSPRPVGPSFCSRVP